MLQMFIALEKRQEIRYSKKALKGVYLKKYTEIR